VAKCKCPSNGEVDCPYTSLTYVPKLVGKFKTLNASHNRITTLERTAFQKLVVLRQEVVTSSTEITGTINQLVFVGQSDLKMIDLSWNSIVFMHSEVFAFTPKLMWLSLANNAALQLPENGLFVVVKSLKILDFSYCNISNIGEDMFKTGEHSLEKLYLQHNIISAVHESAFISFEHLQVLDLSYNRLVSLGVTALIPLKQIHALKLQNNSWLCDCSIQDIYSWSVVEGVQLSNVTCNILQGEFGLPWSGQIRNMNCGNIRARRHTNYEPPSDSGFEKEGSSSPIALIIIGILAAVVMIVILCVCLFNSNHECMEVIGYLLICHHCYQ
jgi:Leucine-rich repeat (LRR) protein